MINKFVKPFLSSILVCSISLLAYAAETPLPMIKGVNEQIISVLQTNQSKLKENPKIIEQAITKYFIPHVDTVGMSRSVLGRIAWTKATTKEKNQFTHEFTRLVLRTYAQPLVHYSGEKVEFLPMKASNVPQFSQIQSIIIRPNGQRIPVTYHLVRNAQGEWKVYDLSVEGVSLLNSFRNQFGQALHNEELKSIISKMHQKNLS